MSNLELGTEIYAKDDYKLMYHADGHVKSWVRDYFDGQPLNTWESCDHGTPEVAARSYPGLREQILGTKEQQQS